MTPYPAARWKRLAVAAMLAWGASWCAQLAAMQVAQPESGLSIKGVSSDTGLVTFASASGNGIVTPGPAGASAEQRAASFLAVYGQRFGFADQSAARLQRAPDVDELGIEHVRFQQTHQGVPIRGAEFVVHLKGARVVAANGRTVSGLPENVLPGVAASSAQLQARLLVEKAYPDQAPDAQYGEPALEILDRRIFEPGSPAPRLAWFVEATTIALREFIWVDAQTNDILFHFNQLPHAKNRKIYTAGNTTTIPGTLVRSEGGAATGDTDQDNAYTYAGVAYDYYLTNHGRDSFDNAGGAIISTTHYRTNYANAFWNGVQMVYGDGFASADDVVGHELTHAVTERTANLLYYNQSGALNESFSDIFGETIDLVDGLGADAAGNRWQMGEDLPGSIGVIRHMMIPSTYGDPGKMSDSSFVCSSNAANGSGDNGGVHSNSGLPNHAFALMVDGGTYNNRTVSGIGLEKAAKIEYRALSVYLTSGSGFLDAYNALNQSCTDLIGTVGITASDCSQVTTALQAVEMNGTVNCPGAAAAPALCPSGTPTSTVFADDFEAAKALWTLTSTTSSNWARSADFVKTGTRSHWGPDTGSVSDHKLTMASAVTIPSSARLYFDHAFEFENSSGSAWDGGVVEYSTNGGTTWVDAGGLIEAGQGYNATLSTGYSNPLGGRSAFGRSSYGYTGTRLDLSSLAGQSVKFRFRVGTDSLVSSFGWYVDNVSLHACGLPPENSAPTISGIGGYTTAEDTPTGSLAFTVGDLETTAGSLSVSASASNPALVPTANIAFSGSGASRFVVVTPAPNENGSATITLTVSDGAKSTSTSFGLTVTAVNDAPTVAAIGGQTTSEDVPTPAITVTIGDIDTAAVDLMVTGSSSNSAVVPASGVVFGGSTTNRTVTLTPAADANGTSSITVNVSDGSVSTSTVFVVTVSAVNDAPTIAAIGTQTTSEDTPTGAIAVSVGDVDTSAANLTVTATASNSTLVPAGNIVFAGSGASRTMTVTPAANHNGDATLTVTVSDGSASAATSFALTISAVDDTPTISAIAGQAASEDTATGAIAFVVGDVETPASSLALSAAASNGTLVPAANIAFGGSGASRTMTVTPAANQSGETTITITVNDGNLSAATTLTLTVSAVNDAPTITTIAAHTIAEDAATGAIAFSVGDIETTAASLVVTAASSNPALLPAGSITLGGVADSRTVALSPASNQNGSATVTITVTDGGLSTSTAFVVNVTAVNDPPTITAIAGQSTLRNVATGAIAFTIGDVETAATSLALSAGSSDSALVPASSIAFGGSGTGRTVSITPAANQIGTATVTLTVSDGSLTGTSAFLVVVNGVTDPQVAIDAPASGIAIGPSVAVSGWAVDRGAATGTGVDAIHVYAYPIVNGVVMTAGTFVGQAAYGAPRADLGAAFGSRFTNSGYSLTVTLGYGSYRLVVYAHSTLANAFNGLRSVDLALPAPVSAPAMSLDSPSAGAARPLNFAVSGWAVDRGATAGTGVDAVHVYAYPLINGVPSVAGAIFVGQASYGLSRPDVGGVFGSRFTASGYAMQATLAAGSYRLIAYARSTLTGTFNNQRTVDITVSEPVADPLMSLDGPQEGATVEQPFLTGGWAVDRGGSNGGGGTGVDAVHVWAFPILNDTIGVGQFVDAAILGGGRPDVGAVFGADFTNSGFNFLMHGLTPGQYIIGVYAHSTVSGTFNQAKFARVTVTR